MNLLELLLVVLEKLDTLTEDQQREFVDSLAKAAAAMISSDDTAEAIYLAVVSDNMQYFFERVEEYIEEDMIELPLV